MKLNFFALQKPFLALSLLMMTGALVLILNKGFSYGTDFTGGIEQTITATGAAESEELKAVLRTAGLEVEVEKVLSAEHTFVLRLQLIADDTIATEDKLEAALKEFFTAVEGGGYTVQQSITVGGVLSEENKENAFIISFIVILLIIAYITFRFEFRFGLGAVAGVVHDLLLILGFVVLFDREVSVLTIVALLTIFGYSVNDSIIIFDRVREKNQLEDHDRLVDLLNSALNSVLTRTLITSLTTLIVVGAIYFSTTGEYRDFALNLMIGIVSGTYSSIYIAGPVIRWWERFKPYLKNRASNR